MLKSVLRNPLLGLLFRISFWVFSLFVFRATDLGFWSVVLVLISFVLLYLDNKNISLSFAASILLLALFSLFTALYINSILIFSLIIFLLGMILFLISGVRDLVFLNRRFVYRLAQFLIFFFLFILSLGTPNSEYLFLKYAFLFFYTIWLGDEAFRFLTPEIERRKSILYGTVLGLIVLELTWAMVLLPIHFVGGGIIMAMVVFIFFDFIITRREGEINWSKILCYLGFMIIIVILVGLQSFS